MEEVKEIKKVHRKINKIKKRVAIPILVVLTGIYVFTTADLQKQVMSVFVGGVASSDMEHSIRSSQVSYKILRSLVRPDFQGLLNINQNFF